MLPSGFFKIHRFFVHILVVWDMGYGFLRVLTHQNNDANTAEVDIFIIVELSYLTYRGFSRGASQELPVRIPYMIACSS